jgi:transposase
MSSGSKSKTYSQAVKDILARQRRTIGLFVEAVLYRYRTVIPWRDLPVRFGDFRVIHTRFTRWAKSGVWEMVFQNLAANGNNEFAMLDSTIVRAHQHSAGAKKTVKTVKMKEENQLEEVREGRVLKYML